MGRCVERGSSLKISGSTSEGQSQYLHLFKTAFSVKNNDVITIRYKILKGNGDINFVYSKVGSESTEQTPAKTAVHKTSDQFFYDEWNEVQLKVAARGSNVLSAGDWATLGLKFTNAKDLEVLIGEMSIKRGTSKTPTMPIIRRGKVLSDVVTGFDAKLIWTMPNNVAQAILFTMWTLTPRTLNFGHMWKVKNPSSWAPPHHGAD